jgi:predicted permease
MLEDVRFALRLLRKDRSFTFTALLTLAICIGANTAMLSVVKSVLLEPLPFPDSQGLVLLYNSYPNAGAPRVGTATPDYFDRLEAVRALDQQAVFRQEGATVGDEHGAERVESLRATPSLFRMLGVRPAQGRIFTDEEGEVGKDLVALVSDGLWQRKFAGRRLRDETVRLNGTPYQIVGVLPREFGFLRNDTDVFIPASFTPESKSDNRRHNNNWQMVGHIAKGRTIDQVRHEVDALNEQNNDRFPEFRQVLKDAGFHTVVVRLQDDVVRDVKASLYLLWGGVFFVLVIGCVNLANLVIVRANGRTRELATRHAIGGDLSRLARQLLTETLVLAAAGGALGVLVGWWALHSLRALSLEDLPRGYEIALDPSGLGAIAGLTIVVGVVLGLAPAARLRRLNLNVALREESRGGTAGRRARFVRAALATAQVAIALVVLAGAGLLFASFRQVSRADFGFRPANVATVTISLPPSSYKDNNALVGYEQRALTAIRALPNVESAGGTNLVPFSGDINNSVILGEGHEMKPGESLLAPSMGIVTAGYFEAMGVTLRAGRLFDARDTAASTKTVVIDERLARTFWPGRDAVGRRLYRPGDPRDLTKITPDTVFFTVVGVIKDMQMLDPRGDITPVGTVFFPYEQSPARTFTFMLKTRGPGNVTNSVRAALGAIDPEVPVYRPRSMQEWIDTALVGRRVPMLIAVTFALVALFLSAIGVYGVLAYGVAQRRRELGVRLALGGTSSRIFALVLAGGLRILTIGLVAGLGGALAVGQIMRSQLVDITPTDPVVLALVTLILSGVALLACLIPAWRASRIDPIVVLSR